MSEVPTAAECDAIVAPNQMGALRPADVIQQVALVQEVMQAVMKDGEHYGKIPGCGDKPALLQPGAQVLAFTFRLAPSFNVETKDLPNLHREYVVQCNLASIATGQLVATGLGSCSTMESKYRYRNVSDYELTNLPIPADAKDRKAEYRKQGFGMKKIDGVWEWVRFKDAGKVENPDIADTYNTVLKMASKRAFVHATLNATAASDMFTQDIEDLPAASAAPEPIDVAPRAAEKPVFVSKKVLTELRSLRKKLGITDDLYAEQRAAASGHEVSIDAELTPAAAKVLLDAYKSRVDKAAEDAAKDAGFEEVGS